jgi:hypothetical protein
MALPTFPTPRTTLARTRRKGFLASQPVVSSAGEQTAGTADGTHGAGKATSGGGAGAVGFDQGHALAGAFAISQAPPEHGERSRASAPSTQPIIKIAMEQKIKNGLM